MVLTANDKKYINSKIDPLTSKVDSLKGYIDSTAISLSKEFRKEIRKNGVLLEEIRDNFKAVAEGFEHHTYKIDNHEKRISKLENKL